MFRAYASIEVTGRKRVGPAASSCLVDGQDSGMQRSRSNKASRLVLCQDSFGRHET
jgi:hypothetical protein